MIVDKFMPWIIDLLMPHRPAHYVTKPAISMTAYLGFYLTLDYLAHGELTINGFYGLFVVMAGLAPFLALAFWLVIYLNITQQKLADLAMTDMLTNLPNRRNFIAEASAALQSGVPGFMMIADADHFKQINDTYGHGVGDICLQEISQRLKDIQRSRDIVGRIGGEEFGAYFPDRSENEIIQMGQELTSAFILHVPQLDQPLRFTLSIGAAEASAGDGHIDLMQRADEALYEAKATGRAKLVLWRKSVAQARKTYRLEA